MHASLSRSFARPAAPLLVLAALTLPAGPSDAGATSPDDPRATELAAAQNAFALDLYGRLKDEPGNLLFSPYSAHTALAMTRAGARGETAAQMDRVLRLPKDATPESWRSLVASVATAPLQNDYRTGKAVSVPLYSISIANALFAQKGYPLVPAYRQLVATAYGAELREVDFAAGAAVRKEINDWALSKTNRKIRDLLSEGQPTPGVRLALVNAIHFVAEWFVPFMEALTSDADFTAEGGASTRVRMMWRRGRLRYVDDGDVRVAALPYRGHAAEMVIVLPKAVDGLRAVERALTPERLTKWVGGGESRELDLELPRFRFDVATDVTKHLAAMGMPDAFTRGKADLTGMANVPGDPLFVGAVLHKAFIAVDEQGTEAAAVTEVLGGSEADEDKPLPFVCNRPFLFLIRHRATGALLFVGRLAAPAAESAPAAGEKPAR